MLVGLAAVLVGRMIRSTTSSKSGDSVSSIASIDCWCELLTMVISGKIFVMCD